jgi:hypothetical protein
MNLATLIPLITLAINETTQLIAWIHGQSGLTDDQKAAATQKLLAANDAQYAALKAALGSPAAPTS